MAQFKDDQDLEIIYHQSYSTWKKYPSPFSSSSFRPLRSPNHHHSNHLSTGLWNTHHFYLNLISAISGQNQKFPFFSFKSYFLQVATVPFALVFSRNSKRRFWSTSGRAGFQNCRPSRTRAAIAPFRGRAPGSSRTAAEATRSPSERFLKIRSRSVHRKCLPDPNCLLGR